MRLRAIIADVSRSQLSSLDRQEKRKICVDNIYTRTLISALHFFQTTQILLGGKRTRCKWNVQNKLGRKASNENLLNKPPLIDNRRRGDKGKGLSGCAIVRGAREVYHLAQWQIEIKLLIFQARTKPRRLNSSWLADRDDVNRLDNLSRDATMTRLQTFNIDAREFDIYTYIFHSHRWQV